MTHGRRRERLPLSRMTRRLTRWPRKEERRTLVAAIVLAWANLALKLLPFRTAITLGSLRIQNEAGLNNALADEWASAVARAARFVPWRSVCIHQGLALQWLLRKRGIPAILVYGTKFENGELTAHVWIKVADRIVLGGKEANHFHEMTSYPSGVRAH